MAIKRKPRKPAFGEFYVYHDDPRDIVQIDGVTDTHVRFHSRVSGVQVERKLEHFRERFTRVPI